MLKEHASMKHPDVGYFEITTSAVNELTMGHRNTVHFRQKQEKCSLTLWFSTESSVYDNYKLQYLTCSADECVYGIFFAAIKEPKCWTCYTRLAEVFYNESQKRPGRVKNARIKIRK
jgi:hypothetical protein